MVVSQEVAIRDRLAVADCGRRTRGAAKTLP